MALTKSEINRGWLTNALKRFTDAYDEPVRAPWSSREERLLAAYENAKIILQLYGTKES